MLTHMDSTTHEVNDILDRHCRLKPFKHQLHGIHALIKNSTFALFDEMGVGKTKQVIDAAQVLYTQGKIDRIIIVATTPVRDVWYDEELGEIQKHLWTNQHARVTLFHTKNRSWTQRNAGVNLFKACEWIITNYEFIRNLKRLNQLFNLITDKTFLVLDESSAIKNYRAQQTKAAIKIRNKCARVVLLNGTPVTLHPGDMFSQGQAMDSNILACKSFFHFRSKYAVLGGFQGRQIITWRNVEDIQERFKPYVLRRLKIDCLDLPSKLEPVTITATLTKDTWSVYKEMRDEMITWLSVSTVSIAPQAVVKALRLSQLTSGFLGGLQAHKPIDVNSDYLPGIDKPSSDMITPMTSLPPKEVSREKLDVFLTWYEDRLNESPNLKLLVWCRFRAELSRLKLELEKYKVELGAIHGGQKQHERDRALRLLDPRTMPEGPVVVTGTPASGSMGLNLTGAHTVVYLSNDYSLKTRLQSEDRVHRPGQTNTVSYFDVVAVGPQGQKTIDHAVMKSLRKKEDLAMLTTNAWISLLKD